MVALKFNIFSSGVRKSLGPGILLASACIGGSHLMSSTTAGARFGFALVLLIIFTNLIKYPFLLIGSRFTAVTGLSLLEGFKNCNRFFLPIYLVVSLITGTLTIAAVSFVTGLLLRNIPLFQSIPPLDLSIIVLILCGFTLLLGQYKALDKISKILVSLLVLLTGFAVISIFIKGPVGPISNNWLTSSPSPWTLNNLSFLIPLMGWMPGPVELCVWPSLWMFSRSNETNHIATLKEAEFDFNLGYLITVITSLFFVTLGAYTMYGSGNQMISGSGLDFAQNLISLYTEAIGSWARWIIIPASIATMLSTTLTCLDAYPRSISAIQSLNSNKLNNNHYLVKNRNLNTWIALHLIASIILLLIANSGQIGIKDFIFTAMTVSFLTAPIFGWMALKTINSKLVPEKYRFGVVMKLISWAGMIFLISFSLLFILNSFFGVGTS